MEKIVMKRFKRTQLLLLLSAILLLFFGDKGAEMAREAETLCSIVESTN